jgi:hypothetical protein
MKTRIRNNFEVISNNKDDELHTRIILEWILDKYGGKVWWIGCIWLRTGQCLAVVNTVMNLRVS